MTSTVFVKKITAVICALCLAAVLMLGFGGCSCAGDDESQDTPMLEENAPVEENDMIVNPDDDGFGSEAEM